ncbi:MAG: potassium channel family protein [Gallionellaceae bacterium]|nr:potassium channel family protein [Gallionellaceae bacterium]MDD5366020.1 potassium channel family protein [Gallionellaceae bacterium]
MTIALLLSALLILATTLIHFECLRGLSAILPRLAVSDRARVLFGVLGTLIAHMLEIVLYGVAYYFLRDHFSLGNFVGHFADSFATFLYFSAETYTSVGFGDIFPTGMLRMVCGFEALNGLLLIGWSASFTYVFMEHFWNIDKANNRDAPT